jgi:hypothetical protein
MVTAGSGDATSPDAGLAESALLSAGLSSRSHLTAIHWAGQGTPFPHGAAPGVRKYRGVARSTTDGWRK